MSFQRVWAIALATLLGLIRSKIFYFVLIFGIVSLGAAGFLADFSFEEQLKVLKDSSLGALDIFAAVLAIAATAMLLPNDLEDRTLYSILSKPVNRYEYLAGKLTGIFLLLAALTFFMSLVFSAVIYWKQESLLSEQRATYQAALEQVTTEQERDQLKEQLDFGQREVYRSTFSPSLYYGVGLSFVKACLVATITLMISTITSSTLFTILCSAGIYFICHIQSVALEYYKSRGPEESGPLQEFITKSIAVIFPDMNAFNLSDEINAGVELAPDLFLQTAGWGLVYILVYLLIGYLIFAKREL